MRVLAPRIGDVRHAVAEFVERYNAHWRLEKWGFKTPYEARQAEPLNRPPDYAVRVQTTGAGTVANLGLHDLDCIFSLSNSAWQGEDMTGLFIRPMRRDEIAFAIDLATDEGWNPGLHDAECFYNADPEGFMIGLLDGQPIGCISAVSYEGKFGFLGLYMVRPEFRGQGHGIQLWNAAVERLSGQLAGLDGVLAQQPNYMKSGFRLAYRNIRYQGVSGTGIQPETRAREKIADVDFDNLAKYDRGLFPADRARFLKCWIAMPQSAGFACVEDGQVGGMGVIRPCCNGYKIGPLFADTTEIAETLFQALTATLPSGTPFFLDVPEVNPRALELAQRHQLQKVFETARMYTGREPPLRHAAIYGVTTFELG